MFKRKIRNFQKILFSLVWIGAIILMSSSNLQALTLEILKPAKDEKILLEGSPATVKVKVKTYSSDVEVKWKTKIEGKDHTVTVTTKGNAEGKIKVKPYPTRVPLALIPSQPKL